MTSLEDVVDNGMCVGCGACAVVTGNRVTVDLGPLGFRRADTSGASAADLERGSAVCPFADESPDEDEVAATVHPSGLGRDERLGHVRSVRAGRVADDDYLMGSSSGGITSWLTRELLRTGAVDGVVHVAEGTRSGELFGYTVSRNDDELRERRKSQYASTSFDEVLAAVRGDGLRYAFVGVPCFVTAARHVAAADPVLGEQLRFFIGLVCGHLKSDGFGQALAWQAGVAPDDLVKVDFRVKDPSRDAGGYSVGAWATGEVAPKLRTTRELVGGNWGHAMFQLKACDFCDDVFAETADVVTGDAWLPAYRSDWRGTNVVVTRSAEIEALLVAGAASGALELEDLSIADAATSQAGNFRHRWDGLSVRLADDVAAGRWVPRKRVAAGSRPVTDQRRELIRARRLIAETSHTAFARARAAGSLAVFLDTVAPLVLAYQHIDAARAPLARRVARRIRGRLRGRG